MTPLDAMRSALESLEAHLCDGGGNVCAGWPAADVSGLDEALNLLRTAIEQLALQQLTAIQQEMEKASAVELAAVIKERDEWKIGAQEGRKAQEKYMELCEQLAACEKERASCTKSRLDLLDLNDGLSEQLVLVTKERDEIL